LEEVIRRMNGNDRRDGNRGSEDYHERLNRELIELLNELRVAIPGVQVLFAFLLIVPFSQGFPSVTTLQQYVYFATMLCTAVSAALLIAPSSHHRLLWREHEREKRLRAGNRLTIGGLSFLALAMLGAVFLISDVVFGPVTAAVATVVIGIVFGWFWYGQPLLRLRD
jgi:amino acid transporter